jgi:glycosyltransferase involved in cell wall biosynthesis
MITFNSNIILSIITINKNNFHGLLNTFQSLRNICSSRFHHIVIDGDSSDFTYSLDQLQSKYSFQYISETDEGIYNAMNKGIKNVSSEYLLFLNSGDSLKSPAALDCLLSFAPDSDLIFGDVLDLGNSNESIITYPDNLSLEFMLSGGLPHQATVIRKSLFSKIGLYDERYKIISDWVFFMEALFYHKVTYTHVASVISVYEGGGLSSLSLSTNLILYEQMDYIKRRFPDHILFYKNNSPYVKKYLRKKYKVVRWLYKFLLFSFNLVIK